MAETLDESEAETYRLIGEFIVWFSQSEISIRIALAEALNLPPELYDAVTASYDFRTLCDVTLAAYNHKVQDPIKKAKIAKALSEAKAVNDLRVRIAHGIWAPSKDGFDAFHMSRQSLKTSFYFGHRADLEAAVERCHKLQISVGLFPGSSLDISQPIYNSDSSPGSDANS